MRFLRLPLAVLLLVAAEQCPATDSCAVVSAGNRATTLQFKKLMQTVADGWSEPNPKKAADCYAVDAIYSAPPGQDVRRGRENLYKFFHGEGAQPRKMSMVWHHLAFDEESQIGFGEYTFRGTNQFHGVTVVRVVDGKIKNWREYELQSNLDWPAFIGKNQF